jgi:hypothetical protein
LRVAEDIEVRDGSGLEDNPPHYDDVVDTSTRSDDSRSKSQLPKLQLGKPLKSIMKTGRSSGRAKDEGAGASKKGASSGILRQHSGSGGSPRHSASVTASLNSSFNGDIPGAGPHVEVRGRGGSGAVVDSLEMDNLDEVSARRTTSFSEAEFFTASGMSAPTSYTPPDMKHTATKPPRSTSHSHEMNGASATGSSNASSSSHSLNTHL